MGSPVFHEAELPLSAPVRNPAYTVSELLRRLRLLIEDHIGWVTVEGEIADLRAAGSGHCYFTLKDETSRISCVLFAGTLRTIDPDMRPAAGRNVRIKADFSLYEPRGQIQLVVRGMEMGGQGALLLRLEALKRKLRAEGLFDVARKRPLPRLPRHIGIVTSPTGAAIRDILQVLERRYYNLHLLIAPVRVQGDGAARSIAAAIAALNARGGLDVLIVGRGGGSLEDLQAFNEECVARAIAASELPVISAVGHEIDTTLSDWAADLRAPTPSAAAELVVGRKVELVDNLGSQRRGLDRAIAAALSQRRERLRTAMNHHVFRRPQHAVACHRQLLDALDVRMGERIQTRLTQLRGRLVAASAHVRPRRWLPVEMARTQLRSLQQRLTQAQASGVERLRRRLEGLQRPLTALDPNGVLARGYSMTFDERGRSVQRASQVRPGDRLRTRLAEGEIVSGVLSDTP